MTELVIDNLPRLVAQLYDVRRQKKELEKVEKDVLAEIKPLVDPEFDTHMDLGLPISESVMHFDNLDMSRVQGTSRSIQADLLLERGVSPEIVNYATKTTTYYQYRVKEAKEE